MNLKTLQQIAKWGRLTPSELTAENLAEISSVLGFPIEPSNELLKEVSKALVANDVDTLADIFNKPTIFAELARLFQGANKPASREFVKVCPHCGEIIFLEVKL